MGLMLKNRLLFYLSLVTLAMYLSFFALPFFVNLPKVISDNYLIWLVSAFVLNLAFSVVFLFNEKSSKCKGWFLVLLSVIISTLLLILLLVVYYFAWVVASHVRP
jgi:hypothetical protein